MAQTGKDQGQSKGNGQDASAKDVPSLNSTLDTNLAMNLDAVAKTEEKWLSRPSPPEVSVLLPASIISIAAALFSPGTGISLYPGLTD